MGSHEKGAKRVSYLRCYYHMFAAWNKEGGGGIFASCSKIIWLTTKQLEKGYHSLPQLGPVLIENESTCQRTVALMKQKPYLSFWHIILVCGRWHCCWAKNSLSTDAQCFPLKFWPGISSSETCPRFPRLKEEDKYVLFLILFNIRFLYHNRNSSHQKLLPVFLSSIFNNVYLLNFSWTWYTFGFYSVFFQ